MRATPIPGQCYVKTSSDEPFHPWKLIMNARGGHITITCQPKRLALWLAVCLTQPGVVQMCINVFIYDSNYTMCNACPSVCSYWAFDIIWVIWIKTDTPMNAPLLLMFFSPSFSVSRRIYSSVQTVFVPSIHFVWLKETMSEWLLSTGIPFLSTLTHTRMNACRSGSAVSWHSLEVSVTLHFSHSRLHLLGFARILSGVCLSHSPNFCCSVCRLTWGKVVQCMGVDSVVRRGSLWNC